MSPGFSGSSFFPSQGFSGPRFFRVRIQGAGPGSGSMFRSSRLSLVLTIDFCYLQLIFFVSYLKKTQK